MKTFSETQYIHRLIAEGEHQTQDFKFEISDACKIAKTLSAFSNTDGGRLLIGVKDNGKIAGIRSEEEIYMIEAAARMYCIPPIECQTQGYTADGKNILVATVAPAPSKPVYAKDENGKPWAYIRIKDENILATAIHLRVWHQSQKEDALLRYTQKEENLLKMLAEEKAVTLNQYCRRTHVQRRKAETLFAQLVRFGIIEPVFIEHKFHFRLKTA